MSNDQPQPPRIQDDFAAAGASLPPQRPTGDRPGRRRLIDREGTVSLDNGAVRFAPTLEQGWGRSALAYGPFRRQDGLALAAYLLNGHNTAQVENLPDSLRGRLDRWSLAHDQDGRLRRLAAWPFSGRVRRTLRLFRWWWTLRSSRTSLPHLDENLAVGWFTEAAPRDPVHDGNGFVMHATGGDNGELWTRTGDHMATGARAVPDIPLGLVVVLRCPGAVYYAAADPGGAGLPPYPWVRPIAIDTVNDQAEVYGVVSPAAYGQIGFRIDTRVYAVQVATPSAFAGWCGAAGAADRLTGSGGLADSAAERGGLWRAPEGRFRRTPAGLQADGEGTALLPLTDEVGLVHAVVRQVSTGAVGLVVRAADANNLVRFTVGDGQATLHEVADGAVSLLARADLPDPAAESPLALQVRLDGDRVVCSVAGREVLAAATGGRAAGHGVGLYAAVPGAATRILDFEAHPARLLLPAELQVAPLAIAPATRLLVSEDFTGPPRDLADRKTSCGAATWSRRFGKGRIETTGHGEARVIASHLAPNPGRTGFTVPWPSPGLAELDVEMTVPGEGPGDKHKPRGGFVFEQDPDNHLIVSLWRGDEYPGGSVSSFFRIGGFDEIYDAVWTNIGRRAWYGDRVRLRVTFDGLQYLVSLDGQPVLYRRLTDIYPDCPRLQIRQVGLVANWEWGDDTGTRFRDFTARGSADAR